MRATPALLLVSDVISPTLCLAVSTPANSPPHSLYLVAFVFTVPSSWNALPNMHVAKVLTSFQSFIQMTPF